MNKIILFFLLLPLTGFCQVTDDFIDGNFTFNPTWSGSDTNFIVTLGQLQSKGPHYNGNTIGDTIYLSTPNILISSTEWRFLIDLKFNPTSDNLVKVFLVSDTSDLKYNLNGYYIEIGQTTADNIKFYRQDGASSSLLFTGTSSFSSDVKVGIKVTRDASGNWQVFSDPSGGTNYNSEGSSFLDNTYSATLFFGIYCQYKTDTRYNQYYFDDFYVGPIIIDVTPPTVSSVLVISPTQLDIAFSESVSTATAENITNYSVNTGIGNPATAVKDGTNGSLVHLTFASAFLSGAIYTITISNVQDLSNNPMTPDSSVFALYTPKAYDILINEIFPDPDPQVGLPDYEYAELYNRTPYSLNLKNWKLTVGTTVKVFPSVVIEPDSFLILTSTSAVSFFITYGQVVGFSSFPTLINTGATLILSDSLDHIIHAVTYSDTWYQDSYKKDGGWSLELIDPANPCGNIANWIASIDPAGGTPGKKNSVFSSNPDNIPPHLSNINVISASCIQLNFSEPLDSVSLVNPASYLIDNGIGIPTAVSLVRPDYKKVILYLGSALQQNILYTCTVTDTISDCAGNTTVATSSTFAWYDAKQFDVVINEIMADPDPPVVLANYEYVELYNRTIYPISMKGWKFQMGTALETVPDATINPHAYLLLTTTNGEAAISSYGNAIGVTSFAISNTGETLSLYDSLYRTISTVSFTDAWYQDSYKMNGGWSLEQIDPMNPCGDASNWRASNNILGGTPAAVNSINASNPDNTAPQLVRVSLIDNYRIQLYFTEPLDSTHLQNVANYTIDNGINPTMANPVSPDYMSVVLDLSPAVQTGIIYTITITDTLKDCVGNVLPVNSSARFAIPELPIANDLVINEVLSNPKDDGVDYVELYNRSNKVIDLKQLVLASYDTITSILTDVNDISSDGYLVFPQDYVVLTTDPVMVKKQYNTPNPNGFAQMPSLPSLNNDDGTIALSLKNLITIIDKFAYTADMYYPLLNSTDGVSLERINFNRPTDDKTNWHSAAETAGFGTPAYRNSQYSEGVANDDPVSVSPEIFSPDNDGINDVLNINYKFDVAGYTANINVYDANGRLIRNLIKNEQLGTSGNFSWDGITNDNGKARIGIYIIYFEVFDMNGNVKHYKKSAVLASKL